MHKILVSLPDDIAFRLHVTIPAKQRSKVISRLLEKEIERREKSLYSCAMEVEKDKLLNEEMEEWSVITNDGLKGA